MLDMIIQKKWFQYLYWPFLFAASCLLVVYNKEVDGAVAFVLVASLMLVVSSRLTDAMLPVMLLSVFVTRCYNSADVFLARAWVAVPVVAAILFHFLYYRKPIRLGRTFPGLCAVTAAVTLGGIGTISAAEYFAPTALFYVFGLGGGMMIFYLLIQSHFQQETAHEVAKIMYITGLMACFCVIRFYIADWALFIEEKDFLEFQSSNNLSTFLMLALPFPLYFAKKRYVDILSVAVMYICLIFTDSRGGILMGTVALMLVLVGFIVAYRKNIVNCILCSLFFVGFVAFIFIAIKHMIIAKEIESHGLLAAYDALKATFVREGESRLQLLARLKSDFSANPMFGVGIGYTGNADIYSPVKGAMNWYHMWFAQIIGGLGITGILCYGYQLVERMIVFLKNISLLNFTMLLSYVGLFLMSQVNPGEFCPAPYAMLAVTYFALMEKRKYEVDETSRQKNLI